MKISTILSVFSLLCAVVISVAAAAAPEDTILIASAAAMRTLRGSSRRLSENCPDTKPCIRDGSPCWSMPDCVLWYQNSCQHVDGLGGDVEHCPPSAAPSQAPTALSDLCPETKPCIHDGLGCWDYPDCVLWYRYSCQHVEGLGGNVEHCAPSAAPSEAPSGWWEDGFGQDTARQSLSQTTTDGCDLISVYLPSAETDALSALHLEVHTIEYSYYTNVDLVTVEVGSDTFVFDAADVANGMFKLNGSPTAPAAGQASGYGTLFEGDRIALRPDGCVSAAPCTNQDVTQETVGTFSIVVTPCV